MELDEKNPLRRLEEFAPLLKKKDWEGLKKAMGDLCRGIIDRGRGVTLFKGEREYVLDVLSRTPGLVTWLERLLSDTLAETDDKNRNRILREMKLLIFESVLKDSPKGIKLFVHADIVKEELDYIEDALIITKDIDILFKLDAWYLTIGETARSNSLILKVQKLMKEDDFVKSIAKQLADIRSKSSEMDAELEKRKKELSKLSDKNKKLEENFERNRIRLVETLGLFAAIIAFVIAGIVGLQGLTAAGIAISITGLTAGLVVLVTLINIFTSPKTYIWGKVAVLGMAFAILIAWMVVTVIFEPAIFK